MTRDEFQKKVLEKIRKDGKNHVILEFATGLTKTKISFHLAKGRTLVVHKQRIHKENLLEEYEKWGFDFPVEFSTYAGIQKYQNTIWDTVILDECHHITERNLLFLQTIKAKRIIGLSATINREKRALLNRLADFKYYLATLKDGIKWGLLPKPIVHYIPLTLDDKVRRYEFVINPYRRGNAIVTYQNFIANPYRKDKRIVVKCTAREYYEMFERRLHMIESSKRIYDKEAAMLRTKVQRKEFLSFLKTPTIRKIIERLESRKSRYIVFCSSIDQAEELSFEDTVSSQRTPAENRKKVEEFNAGKKHRLINVQILRESMNFKDIDAAILSGIDFSSIYTIQKLGRVLRGKNPHLYILYFRDTMEEAYVNRIKKELPYG